MAARGGRTLLQHLKRKIATAKASPQNCGDRVVNSKNTSIHVSYSLSPTVNFTLT